MSKNQTSTNSFFSHIAVFFRHQSARSLALMFLAHGLLVATYIAQIPAIKTMHQLSDAELGKILLGLPLGITLINPNVGYLMKRFGAVHTTLIGFFCYALAMTGLFLTTSTMMLFFNLLLAGIFTGVLIVTVNTMVTRIEQTEGIHVMSSCHGMFSLGAMLGAGLSSITIAKGISPIYQMAIIGSGIVLLNFFNKKYLDTIPTATAQAQGKLFAWPNKELGLLILIGITVSFGEGIVNDWSAVYLRDSIGASPEIATLGYGGCALSMMIFRFSGDALIPKYGPRKLLFAGGVLCFLGLLLAVMVPTPIAVIAGFTIVGAGIAMGVPMLINLAARVEGFSDGAAVGVFSAFAFAGFVIEPPLVGYIADWIDLKIGLMFVGVCCLLGGVLALRLK